MRIKDRVAKVARMEDGLLHILPTSRFESTTRAIDFLMQTRRGDVENELRRLLDRVNLALKGYKPAGSKALGLDEDEDEDEDEPMVFEVVIITGNPTDFEDWSIPDPAVRYAECVNKCDNNGCNDPLLTGSVENAVCLIATLVGGVVCAGVTITTLPLLTPYMVPICGTAAGLTCVGAFAFARATCGLECTQRCQ